MHWHYSSERRQMRIEQVARRVIPIAVTSMCAEVKRSCSARAGFRKLIPALAAGCKKPP